MKYSICTTVYNGAPRLRASLDSLLKYINLEEFEIVIVDSESTDGTQEILKEYASKYPNFKVIEKRCKRGRGRQIAFENSEGEYIIQVDLDTIYYPQWWEFIRAYEKWNGKGKYALQAVYSGIYPRHLLEKVGGWRDLQWAEDWDLWWRLIEINAFKWYPLVTGENWEVKEKEKRQVRSIFKVVYRKFINERDTFIARPEYSLKARLAQVKSWAPKRTYYIFWVPLVTFAKLASISKTNKRLDPQTVMKKWLSCYVDFKIDGKMLYNFVFIPTPTNIKMLHYRGGDTHEHPVYRFV